MKFVSELNECHKGEDIYIVGTGPSLRVFPKDILKGKTTIGLNMAWKTAPVLYGITIHPDLNIPEFMPNEDSRPELKWVVGLKKCKSLLTPDQLQEAEKRFYFFEYHGKRNSQPSHQPSDSGRVLEWVRHPTANNLYVWSSISQTGINLAANMGAKNIILIGCDNTSLLNNHHAHNQHTRWKGVVPEERYRQYYQGLVEIRFALRERGVNLVSLTPFLSLDSPDEDFALLCKEINAPVHIQNIDIPADRSIKMRIRDTAIKIILKLF